jgi:hypothetical protein
VLVPVKILLLTVNPVVLVPEPLQIKVSKLEPLKSSKNLKVKEPLLVVFKVSLEP